MKKVITYGTFDLFHQGHYNIIKRAKDLGDYLIVGVTSESYDIERGKLNVRDSLLTRIENVRKTGLADEIIVEEYQGQKINDVIKYNIDTLVVGSDWRGKFDYLKNYCNVVYLERTKNISSTQIREETNQIFRIGIITDNQDDGDMISETRFVSGLHVESVFSEDPENAKKFCDHFELDSWHDSMDSFLDSVDLVYIHTPISTRYAYARQALLKKKYVICDGPATLLHWQQEDLLQLAGKNQVVMVDKIVLAYLRAFTQLVWLLRGGLIGSILNVSCSISSREYESDDMTSMLAVSIFVVLKLLGLSCLSVSKTPLYDEDGRIVYQQISLHFPNSIGTIQVGTSAGITSKMEVIGTRGRVMIPDNWWHMGYFEAMIKGSPTLKRYSFNFEGSGLRYLLQEMMIMIHDHRTECSRIFNRESSKIVELIEELQQKAINNLWYQTSLAAKGFGTCEGRRNTCSKEAWQSAMQKGHVLLETGLQQTSDGKWVLRGSTWARAAGQKLEPGTIPDKQEFLSLPYYGSMTPLSLEDLFDLLRENPDCFVMLRGSCKEAEEVTNQYGAVVQLAKKKNALDLLQRLIPEVYRASMLYTLLGIYPFSNYLYSIVGERSMTGYEKIAVFCQKTHIPVVLMSMKHWNSSVQRVFSDHGILVYLSGVTDPTMRDTLHTQGVYGFLCD